MRRLLTSITYVTRARSMPNLTDSSRVRMLKLQKVTFFRAWSGALKMVRGGGVTDPVTVTAHPRAKIGAGTSALIRCITLSSKVTAPDAVEGRGVVAVEFASSSSGVAPVQYILTDNPFAHVLFLYNLLLEVKLPQSKDWVHLKTHMMYKMLGSKSST